MFTYFLCDGSRKTVYDLQTGRYCSSCGHYTFLSCTCAQTAEMFHEAVHMCDLLSLASMG